MERLDIHVIPDEFDCDCCGFMTNYTAEIYADGHKWAEFYHDSHFGGGEWDSEDDTLYALILAEYLGEASIGIEVGDGECGYSHVVGEASSPNVTINIESDRWASIDSDNETVYACFLRDEHKDDIVQLVERYFESEGVEVHES